MKKKLEVPYLCICVYSISVNAKPRKYSYLFIWVVNQLFVVPKSSHNVLSNNRQLLNAANFPLTIKNCHPDKTLFFYFRPHVIVHPNMTKARFVSSFSDIVSRPWPRLWLQVASLWNPFLGNRTCGIWNRCHQPPWLTPLVAMEQRL